MKKISFLLFIVIALFVLNSGAKAQNYYTYDGTDFSVLLTCDSYTNAVTNVEFSANGKWYSYTILDYTDLEDASDGGFAYTCLDGKGVKFIVDYYRKQDYIKVTRDDTGKQWTLYRRNE
ncbi:MAG: hypothetical protein JSS63_00945 [Bacteroidetes bacterium]|nr:hypothetical protein [Bacteroidota bacterium]